MRVVHILLSLIFSISLVSCLDPEGLTISETQSVNNQSKRANIWYFGRNAGLDFNRLTKNGDPTILTDGEINTEEGCSIICDENGQLLFYTDGETVWNRLHKIMPNGFGLKGSFTSTQSALITPHPGSTDLYYVFTTAFQGQEDGLNYSMVDMALDDGFGDISVKNVQLYTPTTEKLTAVHHANGEDLWVITHLWESDAFYVFRITKEGLDEVPIISRSGSVHEYGVSNANAIGEMKASPSGKKLALNIAELQKTEIFDFDVFTGEISFLEAFITPVIYAGVNNGHIYGIAFSPNEEFLYISENFPSSNQRQNIYQYNVVNKKLSIVDSVEIGGGLQLGIDKKLYAVNADKNEILVIDRPNLQAGDHNFKIHTLSISPGTSLFCFPNFIQSYLYSPDPIVEMPNAFSPNGDGRNDILKPSLLTDVESFEMKVFNRTGVEVYSTSDGEVWWDGANAQNGIFYWSLNYDGVNGYKGKLNGWVQLLR